MIKSNVRNLMRTKGIRAPLAWMTTRGIPDRAARQLLKGTGFRINFEYISILCYGLRCAPDDLFAWEPDSADDDMPNHPLQKLRRKDAAPDVSGSLQELTPDEISKVQELIDGLRRKEKGNR